MSGIIITSVATGIAGATFGATFGAFAGCLIGGLPMGGRTVGVCYSMARGIAIGGAVGAVGGFISPAMLLLIKTLAQAVFWSFSYLTAGGIDAVIVTATANPVAATVCALVLLTLARPCAR